MGEGARTARILVIDDEPALARMIERMLERDGWVIEIVMSGEDALHAFAETAFDVLVVDKNLPGIDGVELIREVRRTDKAVGILMVTGFSSQESAAEVIDLGVDGYIEKPFRHEDLVAQVEIAMANAFRRAVAGNLAHAKQLARSVHDPTAAGPKPSVVVAAHGGVDPGWLDQLDADVRLVACNAEALEAVRAAHVDLVLLDAASPGVLATAESVRTEWPETGCIVIGPTPEFSVLQRLINIQVIAVVDPSDPDRVTRINTLITGRAPRGAIPFSE